MCYKGKNEGAEAGDDREVPTLDTVFYRKIDPTV